MRRQLQSRIVAARETDLPGIAALAGVIWRAHYPGIISAGQIEYMLARMYNLAVMEMEMRRGICYDCLFVEKQMIAFASYGSAHIDEIKLHKLYVHPDWQHRGFGSLLLRHVEQVARQRMAGTLCLTVNKANAKAIAAYQKNGFSVRESIVADIGGGFVMDDYFMAKTSVSLLAQPLTQIFRHEVV